MLRGRCKAEKSEGNGCWSLEEPEEVARRTHHKIYSLESAPSSGWLFYKDSLPAEGEFSRRVAGRLSFDSRVQIQQDINPHNFGQKACPLSAAAVCHK